MSSYKYPMILLIVVLAFWVWSGIEPHDTRLTWVLETFPFMIALPIILYTYKQFALTNLTYTLIAIHAMILMLGGHYSYAKVPVGFWMEDWFAGLVIIMTRSDISCRVLDRQYIRAKYWHEHHLSGAVSGYALYLLLYLYLFQQYTKLSNGSPLFQIRPIPRPFLEHRVTSGTRRPICFGV